MLRSRPADSDRPIRRSSGVTRSGERTNLKQGETNIAKTWSGKAADAEAAYFARWDTALANQKSVMDQLSRFLDDAVTQAVSLAQVVVDIVLTVINFMVAALTNAAIPVWGQWKAIKTVKDGITTLRKAYSALNVFITLLKAIVDLIIASHAVFTNESLPAAPAV